MSVTGYTMPAVATSARRASGKSALRGGAVNRAVVLSALVVAFAAGSAATHTQGAAAAAGPDLVRLLRAMAALKAMMAVAAASAVLWRMAAPIGALRLGAYALACAAMAAGPPLIWRMDHVVAGALLLHAGLAATLVVLWRDPAMGTLLAAKVAARRIS